MKKSFLCLLLLSSCVFSFSGVFRTSVPLYTIETQYFDIIYPEESYFSALILQEKADTLYERLTQYFEVPKDLHLPIVLMPQNDVLNAYFTPYPYNHIVVYDTLPSSDSLNVFSETLVGVFFHELVHAVSLNIRSDDWQLIANIFGDIISPIFLVKLPLFFTEGVTVSFESFEKHQGRMHDSFSLQLLYQAKLENKFPSWKELTNVRGLYPAGSDAYIIGGAFSTYLQKKYGLEKYVEFWKSCDGRSLFFNYPHFIQKYYQKTMDELWIEFQNAIPVPENLLSFPSSEIADNGLFKSLTYSKDMIVWINSTDKNVYAYSRETKKIKKIFSTDSSASRLSFSQDGKYLVVSKLNYKGCVGENQLKVFDMDKRTFVATFNGYKDGTMFQDEQGNNCIAGVKTEGQCATIQFLDFLTKEVLYEKKLPDFSIPSFLTDKGKGELLYCYTDNLHFYFVTLNPLTKEERVFKTLDNIRLRYLHPICGKEGKFSFGYTPQTPNGNQCRVGIVSFYEDEKDKEKAAAHIYLQKENISGGFYNPVLIEEEIYFISHKYHEDTIQSIPLKETSFTAEQLETVLLRDEKLLVEQNTEKQKYNPLKYPFKKGTWLINAQNYSQVYRLDELPLLAYGSCDPTETWQFSLALQTGFVQNSFGFLANIGYFMPSWYCNVSLQSSFVNFVKMFSGAAEANTESSLVFGAMLDCAKKIVLNKNYNTITFGNTLQYIQENIKSLVANTFSVQFSTIHSVGLGSFENLGLSLTAYGSCYFYPYTQSNSFDYFPSVSLQGVLPRLLPFSSALGYTYNLPMSVSFSYLPLTQTNAFIELFSCTGDMVIFAKDTYFYSHFFSLNQIAFSLVADYSFGVSKITSYKNAYTYFDKIDELEKQAIFSLRTSLKFSYLYGSLSSIPFDIYFDFSYNMFSNKIEFSICGISVFDKSLSLRSLWQKIVK
ncbi:MAG: hypothetical protein E7062_08415 [Spirochaetaceae bacterium]|nr:hypothetical protein [Spirochaetaceae bacterium]